jgi:predicted transposase/invertase (TIGR01784 family)
MTTLLSPLTDLIFKRIFGDARNADILANLLLSILDLPEDDYAGLEFEDTHLKPEIEGGKLVILDVKVKTKAGTILDIEIQVCRATAMRARILFYASKLITDQMSESDNYKKIKPVILIVIADFNLLPEEAKYHNVYRLLNEDSHRLFSGLLEIHTIELKKLPEEGDGSELGKWMRFMKMREERDIRMLEEGNPMIQKAYGVLRKLSADEEFRLQVDAREKALRDYYSLVGDRDDAFAERDAVKAERDALKAKQDAVKAERDAVKAERDNAFAERDAVKAKQDKVFALMRTMGLTDEQIAQAIQN